MKSKAWLGVAGGAILSFLLTLLHLKSLQVKSLKAQKQSLEEEKEMQRKALEAERETKQEQADIKSASDSEIDRRFKELWK